MDLISAFKSELFRPLATVIAPGTVAVTPWALTFLAHNHAVVTYAEKYVGASAFFFIVLTTIAGFLLENIGARIEKLWDSILSKSKDNHNELWNEYLRLKTKDEIVGQRYLRTIVTRMKFELAIAPALFVCVAGLFALNIERQYWTVGGLLAVVFPLIAIAVYLLFESFTSAKTCARARDQVIKACVS